MVSIANLSFVEVRPESGQRKKDCLCSPDAGQAEMFSAQSDIMYDVSWYSGRSGHRPESKRPYSVKKSTRMATRPSKQDSSHLGRFPLLAASESEICVVMGTTAGRPRFEGEYLSVVARETGQDKGDVD